MRDQFRLRAPVAIQGGSARHLGTSLEKQALGITFTPVLSLSLFSLAVYPVFMPGGAAATHGAFGIAWLSCTLILLANLPESAW